jgi:hypothetical protein
MRDVCAESRQSADVLRSRLALVSSKTKDQLLQNSRAVLL